MDKIRRFALECREMSLGHHALVKHRWDPDGLIRSNHAVAVAPA
jgi:hypothetical protein